MQQFAPWWNQCSGRRRKSGKRRSRKIGSEIFQAPAHRNGCLPARKFYLPIHKSYRYIQWQAVNFVYMLKRCFPFILVVAIVAGCGKDKLETKPTIELKKLNGTEFVQDTVTFRIPDLIMTLDRKSTRLNSS